MFTAISNRKVSVHCRIIRLTHPLVFFSLLSPPSLSLHSIDSTPISHVHLRRGSKSNNVFALVFGFVVDEEEICSTLKVPCSPLFAIRLFFSHRWPLFHVGVLRQSHEEETNDEERRENNTNQKESESRSRKSSLSRFFMRTARSTR